MTGPELTRREALAWSGAAVAATAVPAVAQNSPAGPSLLYPHDSATRTTRDLLGLWRFQLDPEAKGEAARWFDGLPAPRAIPVPSS